MPTRYDRELFLAIACALVLLGLVIGMVPTTTPVMGVPVQLQLVQPTGAK